MKRTYSLLAMICLSSFAYSGSAKVIANFDDKTLCQITKESKVFCKGSDLWDLVSKAPKEGMYTAVSVGQFAAVALNEEGHPTCWGASLLNHPVVLKCPKEERFQQVSVGDDTACGITMKGFHFCWGASVADMAPHPQKVIDVSVGKYAGCLVSPVGLLTCFAGFLGGAIRFSAPQSQGHTKVSVSDDIACSLTASGKPECWGDDTEHPIIKGAPAEEGFFALSVGKLIACAIKPSKGVCWGSDDQTGELIQREFAGNFTDISAGRAGACALDHNGELVSMSSPLCKQP